MRRRDFVSLLGIAAAAWPLAARAQQPAPVIGFLSSGSQGPYQHLVAGFLQGLKETGYVEGQNVALEYRWAEGRHDRLQAMAADLVRRRVNVIAATTTPAALAAEATGTTIPIVFDTAGDPVRLGLVASLNKPGRNITGVAWLGSELVAKRLGLMRDLIPTARAVAFLVNPADPRTKTQVSDIQEAARPLGLQIHVLHASTEAEINAAFVKLAELRTGALIVGTGELFNSRTELLVRLAARHGLPAIYQAREFVVAGGLISYGASRLDAHRQTGAYVGRILKGEKPTELPVLQSIKFELVINLKTAKTLGLAIPSGVLAIADEVVE
jgi:putative ABC transport system substrate-binding protein